MTENYIFDSTEISEEKVDEEIEFGYEIFAESMQGDKVVNKLNEQHETIQFKEKHIFCLQSVIQTIDVELQEKGMTKERFEEIKDYWYQNVMWNERN